mgnify:CR=1 FL=1
MNRSGIPLGSGVHCRIGSLEIEAFELSQRVAVHCRIGSLEIHKNRAMTKQQLGKKIFKEFANAT